LPPPEKLNDSCDDKPDNARSRDAYRATGLSTARTRRACARIHSRRSSPQPEKLKDSFFPTGNMMVGMITTRRLSDRLVARRALILHPNDARRFVHGSIIQRVKKLEY
jgi:hypothetical protein